MRNPEDTWPLFASKFDADAFDRKAMEGAPAQHPLADKLERLSFIEAAYDKRSDDAKKNYGIHGVAMRWVLRGNRGATQFLLFTNWQLPHVTKEMVDRALRKSQLLDETEFRCFWQPMPADLGYHSYVPQYEGHESRSCDLLQHGECYYDGSGLAAERVFNRMLREGDKGLWDELEMYYHQCFDEPSEGVQ